MTHDSMQVSGGRNVGFEMPRVLEVDERIYERHKHRNLGV